MPLTKTRLTDRQRELLAGLVVEGNVARFTGPIISDWAALKKVMSALGGTWKKGKTATTGGFAFPDDVDAAEAVRLARESGEVIDPNEHDFYPTPEGLAAEVVERLMLPMMPAGGTLLEPSAGQGALLQAVIAKMAELKRPLPMITAIELLPRNVAILNQFAPPGVAVIEGNFLALAAKYHGTRGFDRIVMNPPFTRRADVQHVTAAHGLLRPGGRLVAIMSAGVRYRDDKIGKTFRALVDQHEGQIFDNPDGSFSEVGTDVRTVMVVLPKLG